MDWPELCRPDPESSRHVLSSRSKRRVVWRSSSAPGPSLRREAIFDARWYHPRNAPGHKRRARCSPGRQGLRQLAPEEFVEARVRAPRRRRAAPLRASAACTR
jgi:hypothetical protein